MDKTMEILENLMRDTGVRISYGSRWIVLNRDTWIVYWHKMYSKKIRIIEETRDFAEAVKKLRGA